jgi:thiol:disulfide interchange protein DsbC
MNFRLAGKLAAVLMCTSLFAGGAMAQQGGPRVGSNTATPAANVLSTMGNTSAAPAEILSTKAPANPESVRQAFDQRFPGLNIDAIKPTPFPGLYEVQIGMDLVYVDADVNYILQGSLIDAHTRRDLTAERLEDLSKVSFADLPLELAVKQVKGDGSRKIAVFEDPNCGYCKRLHQTLDDVDNITVYTLLFPILSPDSTVKARNIWCAKDQAATWRAWMLDGKVPPEANCEAPLDTILALGRKMMVRGTPNIVFADGSRVNGALPLDALKQKLDAVH